MGFQQVACLSAAFWFTWSFEIVPGTGSHNVPRFLFFAVVHTFWQHNLCALRNGHAPRSVSESGCRSPPSPPDQLEIRIIIDWKKDAQTEREREWKNAKEISPKHLWNLPATYVKHVWNISETECKSEAKLNASTTNRLRPKFCCLVGQWCVGVAGVWETSSKTLFGLEPLCTRRLQQPVQHSRQPSSATVDCQFSPLGAPRVWIFQRPWNSSDGPMRGLHISGVFHYNYKSLGRHRHYSSKLAIAESLRVSDFSDTLLHTFLSDLIWNCDIPSSIMNGTGILASLSKFLNE